MEHYSSSCNKETYEMIPNVIYTCIPKCGADLKKRIFQPPKMPLVSARIHT